MAHTSSIIDSDPFLSARNDASSVPLRELLENKSCYSSYAPGEAYSYSNFGVAVLADVAESITGEHFSDYARENVFRPMGLSCDFLASHIEKPELIADLLQPGRVRTRSAEAQLKTADCDALAQTYHIYQGNLTSCASDYARLLCLLMNGGWCGENRIISQNSADEIMRTQYESSSIVQCLCLKKLSSAVPGRTVYAHTGNMYGAFNSFAFDASDSTGVVVITTGVDAQLEASGLYDVCGEIIREIYTYIDIPKN